MAAFIGITAEASVKGINPVTGERYPIESRLNKATLVTNWTQYTNVFGDFVSGAYLPDAVYGYFANGGGPCYITSIRAVSEGDTKAMTAEVSVAAAKGESFKATAKTPGPGGNNLTVVISEDKDKDGKPTGSFTMLVGGESKSGLTVKKTDGDHFVGNASFSSVSVSHVGTANPVDGSYALSGGGIPPLTAKYFIGEAAARTGLGGLEALDDVRLGVILALLGAGSPPNESHRVCGQGQDASSLRCLPEVHGALRGALTYVASALRTEDNSFPNNPLVLARDDGGFDVISGGNFHGATVAVPIDHLSAALTTLATISERRIDRMMTPASSRGLTAFLADHPGLESGYMMAHVTASALASECKTLSFPASVDSIPTSAGKEDHVSMGPIAARKLRGVVDNLARVLAIEAICAARAIDLRGIASSSRLMRVHATIRAHVAPFTGDRSMSGDVERLAAAIAAGELQAAAQLAAEL